MNDETELDEFEIEESELSQQLSSEGRSVDAVIYRLAGESAWVLEVEDEFGNSSVWEEAFETEADALAEAKLAIEEDGITSLIGPESGSGEWE